MSFTVELLDEAKRMARIESDYRLAQVLGVERTTVSSWRVGRTFPNVTVTYELAKLALMPPVEAIMGVNLDRACGQREAEIWSELRDTFRAATSTNH